MNTTSIPWCWSGRLIWISDGIFSGNKTISKLKKTNQLIGSDRVYPLGYRYEHVPCIWYEHFPRALCISCLRFRFVWLNISAVHKMQPLIRYEKILHGTGEMHFRQIGHGTLPADGVINHPSWLLIYSSARSSRDGMWNYILEFTCFWANELHRPGRLWHGICKFRFIYTCLCPEAVKLISHSYGSSVEGR